MTEMNRLINWYMNLRDKQDHDKDKRYANMVPALLQDAKNWQHDYDERMMVKNGGRTHLKG